MVDNAKRTVKCGSIRGPENVEKFPILTNCTKFVTVCKKIPHNFIFINGVKLKKRQNNVLSKKQAERHISVWSTGGEDLCDPASAAQWFYSTNQNVSKELQLSTIIFLLASDNESLSNLVTYRKIKYVQSCT